MTFEVAEALPYTLLPLSRYARILGINPVHFQGGYGDNVFPLTNRCSDCWPRYSWQNTDSVSQMDLALEIQNAEREIAEQLGWWVAPMWIGQEAHKYPRFHRPEYYEVGGYNLRGQHKSIKTLYGKIIEPGQRKVTLIANVRVAYTDEDSDGFYETATVTTATTYTDVCKVNVYFEDMSGDQEWEIRPARKRTISGGVFTGVYFSWLFVNPDLQSWYPGASSTTCINVDGTTNFVSEVDVYYEENDPTDTSSWFYWEPQPSSIAGLTCSCCGGTGCTHCQLTEQEGCMHIRDAEAGWVVPTPGTYSSSDVAWDSVDWAVCRDPDQVKLAYYCGDLDNRWKRGATCEPLSDYWAQTIAYLATARLERDFCTCGNSAALAAQWRQDLAYAPAGGGSHQMSFDALDNPFGTRRGEVMAWQRVSKIMARHGMVGVGAI